MKLFLQRFIVYLLALMLNLNLGANAEGYESAALNNLKVSPSVSLGMPVYDRQVMGCSIETRESDGDTIFYGVTSGPPALLFVYNLDTRELEDTKELMLSKDEAKVGYAVDMGADGILNIATQSNAMFFRYNPKTKKLTHYGKVFDATAVMHRGVFDSSGNYYFGAYPDSVLIKYDKEQDRLINLGSVLLYGGYARTFGFYNNEIYVGGLGNNDSNNVAELKKYNVETGVITPIAPPTPPGIENPEAGNYAFGSTAGKYMFVRFKVNTPEQNYLGVYDMEAGVWVDYIQNTLNMYFSDYEDGRVYFHNSFPSGGTAAAIFSYAPGSGEPPEMIEGVEGLTTSNYVVGPTFATLKNQEKYPGRTIIAGSAAMGIVIINLQAKIVEFITDEVPAQATNIRTIKGGYNGDVILSSYMGSQVFIYDSYSEAVRTTGPSVQIEGIGVFNNKYYFGLYGKARLTEFDPALPGSATNPKQIAHMASYEQDRAFNVIKAGSSHIVWGAYPDYGKLGGAVGVYNTANRTYKVYKNSGEIAGQAIAGLAYRESTGKIYGSTSAYGGIGSTPVDAPAKIFIMDLSGNIEKSADVILTNDANRQYFVGDMIFDNDGRLWVACTRNLIEVDPDTLTIKQEIRIGGGTNTLDNIRSLPYQMEIGEDGLLYTNLGNRITAVDLDTGETKELSENGTISIGLSTNGNLYYVGSHVNYLYKMPLTRGTETKKPPNPVTFGNIYKSEESIDLYGTVINGTKEIVFARVFNNVSGYTLKEYGMLLSESEDNLEFKAVDCVRIPSQRPVNRFGWYGTMLYSTEFNSTYYVRPYAVYSGEGGELVLHGEAKAVN